MPDVLASSTLSGLELELRTDTQHATAYLNGRPVLTAQRERVLSRAPFAWTLYSLTGAEVAHARTASGCVRMAQAWVRRHYGQPVQS